VHPEHCLHTNFQAIVVATTVASGAAVNPHDLLLARALTGGAQLTAQLAAQVAQQPPAQHVRSSNDSYSQLLSCPAAEET
jgi:hypothetical protein